MNVVAHFHLHYILDNESSNQALLNLCCGCNTLDMLSMNLCPGGLAVNSLPHVVSKKFVKIHCTFIEKEKEICNYS